MGASVHVTPCTCASACERVQRLSLCKNLGASLPLEHTAYRVLVRTPLRTRGVSGVQVVRRSYLPCHICSMRGKWGAVRRRRGSGGSGDRRPATRGSPTYHPHKRGRSGSRSPRSRSRSRSFSRSRSRSPHDRRSDRPRARYITHFSSKRGEAGALDRHGSGPRGRESSDGTRRYRTVPPVTPVPSFVTPGPCASLFEPHLASFASRVANAGVTILACGCQRVDFCVYHVEL